MVYRSFGCLLILGTLYGMCLGTSNVSGGETILWYKQPADRWEEALPLGNGRLGAMVFGGTASERLQLNEGSLWAGEPLDVYPDQFTENWRKLQQLVLDGKISQARQLGLEKLTKSPTAFRSYQPLADLWVDMEHSEPIEDYRRELDLQTGMARVSYRVNGIRIEREALISAVDDVIALRLTTDQPGTLRARVRMTRREDAIVTAAGGNQLHLDGQIVDIPKSQGGRDDNRGGSGPGGEHMKFAARLLARSAGGNVTVDGNALVIDGADGVILLLTAATDFNLDKMNFDRSIDAGRTADTILAKVANKSWERILEDHVRDHRSLFDRVSIDLGATARRELPTDERLAATRRGEDDPGLAELYFQFGRYLLMGSSRRPGRLPAGLQGIWNEQMWAPWEADYHLNINLQMNYWPADLCNLSETVEPFTDWFVRLVQKGKVSARTLYDSGGWVTFHCSNPFGRTTPVGSTLQSQFVNGVQDPLAGAWMAMTLWRHYEFTQDKTYLREKAYPILKGAARFMLDILVEDQDGLLVIVPSASPENQYIHPETKRPVRLTRGSTYHMTLVRVVFEAVIQGSAALETDEELRAELERALAKLPPLKIGKDGTIQEWIEDYEEQNPHHRHVSHLLGLHPFALITANDRDLWQAARKTLEKRGSGGDVGWSNAWKISFYARLRDGQQAHGYLLRLIGRNAFPNLFDACWPGRVFQIEGNLGGTAGIAEMLLQSHAGEIELLPALPAAWPTGSVRGLRARGGYEVDITWDDGRLTQVAIRSVAGRDPHVRYGQRTANIALEPGQSVVLTGELSRHSPD